jgi:hypothetical protein
LKLGVLKVRTNNKKNCQVGEGLTKEVGLRGAHLAAPSPLRCGGGGGDGGAAAVVVVGVVVPPSPPSLR